MRSAWNQGDESGSIAVIKRLTHGKAIMEIKTVDTGTCCGGRVNNQVQMLLLVFNASQSLATAVCSNLNLHFTPVYPFVLSKLENNYVPFCISALALFLSPQ